MDTMELVMKKKDWLIGLRRHFHKYPELGFKEVKTAERIRKEFLMKPWEQVLLQRLREMRKGL